MLGLAVKYYACFFGSWVLGFDCLYLLLGIECSILGVYYILFYIFYYYSECSNI